MANLFLVWKVLLNPTDREREKERKSDLTRNARYQGTNIRSILTTLSIFSYFSSNPTWAPSLAWLPNVMMCELHHSAQATVHMVQLFQICAIYHTFFCLLHYKEYSEPVLIWKQLYNKVNIRFTLQQALIVSFFLFSFIGCLAISFFFS